MDYVFGQVYDFVVCGIGFVQFYYGEFWIVVGVDVFVVEVVVDFVYVFQVVYGQLFEVQFWCYVQVQVQVQCVVVGGEWFGCCVVGDVMYYWCFDFQEVVVVQLCMYGVDDF